MITTDLDIYTTEDQYTSGAYAKRPLAIVRGEGCRLWDDAGNAYIDAASGIAVAALGHNHPALVQAIAEQSATLITCAEMFYNDRRAELYSLLSEMTPSDLDRFFLCNSGTEAVEGALKVARLITGREGIVSTKRAFHGRSTGALSLTWNVKYRKPFQSWLPNVTHVTYNDLDAAREAITEETAAVFVEAIQGESGVYVADPEYLQGLRDICDARGALLVLDEIQAGMGRTGRWFAFEHADIVPDVVVMAKGIAGGVPMGAVIWRAVHGTLPSSTHGSTFGGNPLACAASIATFNALREAGIPERAGELGNWMIQELRAMDHPQVREVRGAGLMIGLELRGRVTPVLKGLQARGIIALPAGLNVLRLLPPLIISREELVQVRDAIRETLDEINAEDA